MCPKVKRYKGKEMSTLFSTEKHEEACLEGHSDSEGKVRRVLGNILRERCSDEVVAIRLDVELGFLNESVSHALVGGPIGGVDGDVANAIAALFEKCAKPVALVGGVAFF